MFNRQRFSARPRPEGPYRRGVFKYIILQYLKDRPSHGYEIIRVLKERFHGLYVPSAGTIYPRLQVLEERGYVTCEERDDRKIYTITDEGRRFLAEHSDLEQEIRDRLNIWENPRNIDDMTKTMNEFGRLGELLSWEAHKMDPERLGRVQKVIARSCEDIENILKG